MRFKVEITDLEDSQWETAHRVIKTDYDFPPGTSRACVTLVHGDEERHVEMPGVSLAGLVTALNISPALAKVREVMAEAHKYGLRPGYARSNSPGCQVMADGQCTTHNQHVSSCPA